MAADEGGEPARGRLVRATLQDGSSIDYVYDDHTDQMTGYWLDAGAWNAGVEWKLDARGKIDRESYAFGDQYWDRDYRYDDRGFLVRADDREFHSAYDYDQAGRPTSIEDLRGARDVGAAGAGARFVAEGVEYVYDDMGRLIRRGELELAYGPLGQLTVARRGDDEWRYYYDAEGNRIMFVAAEGAVARRWCSRCPGSRTRATRNQEC